MAPAFPCHAEVPVALPPPPGTARPHAVSHGILQGPETKDGACVLSFPQHKCTLHQKESQMTESCLQTFMNKEILWARKLLLKMMADILTFLNSVALMT